MVSCNSFASDFPLLDWTAQTANPELQQRLGTMWSCVTLGVLPTGDLRDNEGRTVVTPGTPLPLRPSHCISPKPQITGRDHTPGNSSLVSLPDDKL